MHDWTLWHQRYDHPRAPLSQRLTIVQALISGWLGDTAPDRVSVLSVCAGDGRDILQTLDGRNDAPRVQVTLMEIDPGLCERARASASAAGLQVEVRQVDAGSSDAYRGAAPADLVLLVGMLGNIADTGICTMIGALPSLCKTGALVVWSHRRERGMIPKIRNWLEIQEFAETFASQGNPIFHVGAHRFTGQPRPLTPGQRLFSFAV